VEVRRAPCWPELEGAHVDDVDDGRPPLTMKDRPPALIPGSLLLERANSSGEVTFAMCCAFILAIDILWAPRTMGAAEWRAPGTAIEAA
jgi:hypothetical protein